MGLVIGVGAVIGLGAFLLSKKSVYQSKPDVTADGGVAFYDVDTDNDGLKDWEEALWLTDPKKSDSDDDGIPDADEISSRQKEIQKEHGTTASTDDEQLTQTELFARQFFSTVALANQNGGVTEETLASFGSAFGDAMKGVAVEDSFSLADIHLSTVSKADYQKSLTALFAPLAAKKIDEYAVVNAYITLPDDSEKLDEMIAVYQTLAKGLQDMKVPYSAANLHLSMLNNALKIGIGFINLKNIEDDPLIAVVGLNQFGKYSAALTTDFQNLRAYLSGSGIIIPQ